MPENPSLFKRFFEDLKRRHVVRVAVGYIIVAWVILQVADVLLPAFDTGEWVFRAFVSIAFIGFFITVILAWVFDISDRQVVKTKGNKLPLWAKSVISLPLIIVVGFGGWWVWSAYVTEKEIALHPTELTELPIVAVLPFRNMTGNPENDWLSEGLANLVRDNLTRSKFLRVVSPQKLQSIIGDATDAGTIAELAEEQGIGFILGGEMLSTPDGISVTSRLSDTAGGVDLSARQTNNLTSETLLTASGPIAAQVKQGLNVPRTEQVDIFAADFASLNLSAYESYIAGLGFFLNYQYKEAEQAFNAALQLSPEFAVARYRLAYIQAATGRTEMAEENIQKALKIPNVADREKRYMEAASALFSRDYDSAVSLYKALLQEYPYEIEARELLAKTYWGQYKAEDAVREMQILATEEPQDEVIWSTLGGYLLAMGEFDRAQPALERFARLAPDNPNSFALLGDSLRYQGDYPGATEHYAKSLDIDPQMRGVANSLAIIDYLQGDHGSAEQKFTEIVNNDSLIVRERLDAMFSLQALLAARGDFLTADSLLEQFESELKEEKIREAMATSIRAMLNLETGNTAAASELVAAAVRLSPGVPTRYLFARGQLELHMQEYDKLKHTADEILSHAYPPEDPDRTEDKAAAFLTGMAWMKQGETEKAESELRKATTLAGYSYYIYEMGYARLLMHQGKTDAALTMVETGVIPDQVDERIDLEPARVKSILLRAEINQSAGNAIVAGTLAQQFLSRFNQAGPGHPATLLAQEIVSESALSHFTKQKKGGQLAAGF